ncbi:nonribosomal peptide synthetase 14 [Aspergillus udagawae]|nr:nonribosomal peptide synthetase 14 [Aspergillus udagawae]
MAPQQRSEPIAVVGTGCRFPGDIHSPSQLWEAICSQKDLLTPIPPSRFNSKAFYHTNGERHGSTNADRAYMLGNDIKAFDANFFGINPREAEAIDPQQRMLLETVYEAMEDAGLTISGMKGSDTAVYVGLMTGDYHEMQIRDPENMPMYMATGTARSIVSNRVSYFFDWKGPSMTIDTACSSSLVALHHAVQSLRAGDCRIAVAAGANLILGPEMMIAESNLHMLSPTGRSRMWDTAADGYARGEGFAAVMLKTVSQALADGDPVEYIIRETGVNQDGRTQGITMPNAESQTALIQQVYHRAGLDYTRPEDRCQFFEAHGTGTPRGDPIEARAIRDAFFVDSPTTEEPIYVGSVKTVIGHLEGCAGLAGLLKAAEAVRRAEIPPNMHYTAMNPDIVPFAQHLRVPTKTLPWPGHSSVRRASVNSFGFGGTNAHVIIESYDRPDPSHTPSLPTILPIPFTFSAAKETSLVRLITEYIDLIKSNNAPPLHEIAATLATRRSQHSIRATFSGKDKDQLLHNLETALTAPSVGERKQTAPISNRILGVFTGQGAQWACMGREILLASPMARETLKNLQASLDELPDGPKWTLESQLTQTEDPSLIQEAALSQPLCTAVQVMLVDLLRAAHVSFHTVVGHSSGEIAAAYAAGMISARDAIRIAYYRGLYAKFARGREGGKGAMMAVGISFDEAQKFTNDSRFQGRIAVAASNAPRSVTLSGDEDAIGEAKAIFEQQETFCRLLKVDTAYHSHHMLPCLEPYIASLQAAAITPLKPSDECIWVSSVHGRVMTTDGERETLKAKYWGDNMANTVLFSQAVQKATQLHGPFALGLEVGPHPALKGPVTQTTKEGTGQVLPYSGTLARFGHDVEALSDALGFLWKEIGPHAVDLRAYGAATFELSFQRSCHPQLPRYPWDHSQRFWKESRVSRRYRQRQSNRHDLLGARCPDDHDHEMRWRNTLHVSEAPWLSGHKVQGQIIFPAAGYLVMAMQAAQELAADAPISMLHLLDVNIDRAIALPEDKGVEVMFHLRPDTITSSMIEAKFSCYSATSDEDGARWQRNASGGVQVHLGPADHIQLPSPQEEPVSLVPVKMETFYESLTKIGLEYTGLFQRLDQVNRRAGRATGYAQDISSDREMPVMIHPALLDAAFQTIFAAFCWPEDGSLHGPYVPTHLRSLSIVPMAPCDGQKMTIECTITESLPQTVTADVDIFAPSHPRVQLEGLTCTMLDPPTPEDDCELFAETVWQADAGAGLNPADLASDRTDDLELVDLCERLSYSYLRQLNAAIDRKDVDSFVWHHQRIFEFIDYLFPLIESGQHTTIRAEWKDDSHEWLLAQARQHPGMVDLQLISAVGEHLADVVRGKTTMLEHMIADDTLNRFYKYGLGFQRANTALSRVAGQIAHRYPRMKILEIGAGTGGATKGILEQLGDAFEQYVFTDISTGFFEKAQEQFAEWASRMTFRPLNIEEEVAAQGFEDGTFDLIIASNVLHATRTLEYTMQNVRRLLKPGGYLLLLEVTSDILRVKLMMAGLSGWWLGADDGRRYAPTISAPQWHDLLIRTGFSGVDQRVTDFQDVSKHMTSVMLSQAMDPDVALLRDPLAESHPPITVDRIVLVGGRTATVHTLAEQLSALMLNWSSESPVIVPCLEDMVRSDIGSAAAVVCLADLEQPVVWGVNDERLAGLKKLLNCCRQLLWITTGARDSNPHANMSIGLGRSLVYEYPHIRMQFLDLASDWDGQAAHISTALARLVVADKMELPSKRTLWSVEPEIVLQEGRWMIPRILPNDRMNRRLNASRRRITDTVSLTKSPVEVVGDGADVWCEKADLAMQNDTLLVRTQYALLHGLSLTESARLYLSIGKVEHFNSGSDLPTGSTVLALNHRNLSLSRVPSTYAVPIESSSATPDYLLITALALMVNTVLDQVPSQGHILLVEPNPVVRRLVENRARKQGSSLTVVYFSPGHEDAVYIPRFLPHRHISRRLPVGVDCVLDCCVEKRHPLDELPHRQRTIRLLDIFQNPSASHSSAALPSQEDLKRAIEAASACLELNEVPVQLIPLPDVSNARSSANYTSIIDFTTSSTVQTLVRPIDTQTLFRSDRSYLLVGCTGGLGQSLTRWMVQNGVRYLILTSRSVNKVNQVWLDELERMGAQVHLFELDIADKSALLAMHDHVQQQLPPIAGVANAAMVLSDRLFNDMTVEDLQKVLNPKVAGTAHLDELFSTPTLDFFVLFSSLASIVGNRGQSNYGAANLFMTSLAAQRKQRGLAGSVLDIGMVLGIGYVSQSGIYESTLRRFNYMPISEPKFHVMFTEAIIAGRPDQQDAPAEIITGLHRIAESGEKEKQAFWSGNPRFSHYTLRDNTGSERADTAVVALRKQLAEVEDLAETTQVVSDGFLAKLGRILQVPSEQINPAQPLINLGVDSLMAVEVRSWFLKEMDVDVPVLRILGGASPLELCQEAAGRYMASRAPTPPLMDSSGTSSMSTSQMLGSSQPISSATSHTGPLSSDGIKTPPETVDSMEASSVEEEDMVVVEKEDWEVAEVDRMSFAQERLWFLRVFLKDRATYNVTMVYRVRGPTASALSDAFDAVVNRHDVLRSAYRENPETGLPYQAILRQSPFRLSQREMGTGDGEIEQEFQRLCHHAYDLEHGDSMAAVLLSHGPVDHTLLLGFHHIVFDGFSGQVFIKDLAAALSGHRLPPLLHQYTDFARRQRARVQNEMADDIAYWKQAFATLPDPVPLFDFCQVTTRQTLTDYTTHGVQRSIPTSTVNTFKKMVRQFHATPFHGHLVILQLLLARLLELTEICIGITDANRTDSDFLGTIGFFVNLLPLRFEIGQHESVKGLLQNTRDVTYRALQHSQVPFDVILDALAVPRSTTESPLFQILMNYKMGSAGRVKTEGLEAELLQFQDARNPYDLVFDIEEQDDGTTLVGLQSQSYLYNQEDLGMLLDAYVCLLTSCAINPGWPLGKHTLYHEERVSAALELGTGPRLDLSEVVTLCRRIDETVAIQPVEVAIKDYEGHSLTYEQMHSQIQLIAATLEASGVRPKDYVAVFCEPTIHSVCYLLAIWRLNAVYVPLDPQNPAARLQLILDDCQPKVLIYHEATEQTVREFHLSATKPITFSNFTASAIPPVPDRSESSSPACALYTSGSTGVPKGIVLTHGSFVNQIMGVRHQFSVGRETVLQQSSLGFDVSLDQMLQPLVGGGTLVVAPRHLRGDAVELARLMVREHVTYTYATPSEYVALLRYGGDVLRQSSSWRTAFVGGEALPPHLIRSFYALQCPGLQLINRYGPTEITVSSSCLSIDTCDPAVLQLSRVSVGSSLPNYATYIMDDKGLPLPVGYVGEIVIGGPGVAQGYLQKEELTRERFVADPFTKPQQRGCMYRTGDKGRLLPTGELMYLGRMNGDTQVKLRGFRVELEDIAQTILRVSQGRLADAVVSVRGIHNEDGDRRFLVAFAVPAQQDNGTGEIQPFLDQLVHSLPLPPYMIPRLILAVDHLPRNPNGKLDRRALDQLPLPSLSIDTHPQKLTAAQEAVICVWKRCLDPSSLPSSWSPAADFFQLGGNSLLMVRVQSLLSEAFGRQVALHELFQSSTVQGMAARFAPEELAHPTALIDWESETTPGEPERQAAESASPARLRPSDGKMEVCLTGSTGFLGSALLRHLVADPRVSRIHCVAVRSSDPARPRSLAVASDKIVVYAGDLTAPRLGLDPDTWDVLGEQVDAIIHNGADVSFLKTYHSLRKANVQSTRELACLALRRRIPLHFVSTGGVAQLAEVETLAPQSVTRSVPPANGSMGYIASKWVSEAYLESCAAQFQQPCIIHRPSNIVGEGVPSTDLIHSILEISVRVQGVPALDNWSGAFDFVPVEDVALGVCGEMVRSVDALEQGLASPRYVHHCGAEKIPVGDIGSYLERKHGVTLREMDVDSWLDAARAAGLSAAMESLVTATLTEKDHHLLPSLSR